MPDQASVRFASAYKAMHKAGAEMPEFFDLARDALKATDDGAVLLLHALALGLRDAYEAGRKGTGLPPLKRVQPGSMRSERDAATEWRTEATEHPAAVARRRTRTPPDPAPTPDREPRKRVVRAPR